MRRFWVPGLIFLFCLLASLLFNMPLSHLLSQTELPDYIRLSNVQQATLLAGEVDTVEVHGIHATNFRFKNNLSCLLMLKLCYDIEFDQGHGQVSFSAFGGNLTFTDTRLTYPIETFMVSSSPFPFIPTGNIQIDIDTLNLVQNKTSLHQGRALWSEVGVAGESFDLGEYQLSVKLIEQAYQFELTDHQAKLEVQGNGQLQADGNYQINIDITSKTSLDQTVKSALELIVSKIGLNQYRYQQSGTLNPQYMNYLEFVSH